MNQGNSSTCMEFALVCVLLACGTMPATALAQTVVHGRISDAGTGTPLAAATVSIREFDFFGFIEIGKVTTAADGTYEWSGTCPMPFAMHPCSAHASAAAYVDSDVHFAPSTEPDVLANFSLHRAATISGTVKFATNAAPAAGATVNIECLSAQTSCASPMQVIAASDGSYSASGFPGGTYRICTGTFFAGTIAQCHDHLDHGALADQQPYTPAILADGETRASVNFDLTLGGSISGTIHEDYTHTILANYLVFLGIYDADGALFEEAGVMTDDAGSYVLDGLPGGTYYMKASVEDAFDGPVLYPFIPCAPVVCAPTTGSPIAVTNASTTGGIDFTFHPVAVVSGHVSDATTGVALGGIPVNAADCSLIWPAGCAISAHGAISAPGTGNYTLFVQASARTYIITTNRHPYVDQMYPAIPCLVAPACTTSGQAFAIAHGDHVANVDFSLLPGAWISGVAMDIALGSVAFVSVAIYDATGHVIATVWPDDTGHYEGPAWLAGTYYAQADADGACAIYDHESCPYSDYDAAGFNPTLIVLQQGQVRNDIDFELDSAESIFRNGFGF